ncbi:MAG TPA: hypothetical protein P5198_06955 [Flexilinea sp.]|jgi:hypothetical protein|nr:hypothetical protein [Flexilinea sp.]
MEIETDSSRFWDKTYKFPLPLAMIINPEILGEQEIFLFLLFGFIED